MTTERSTQTTPPAPSPSAIVQLRVGGFKSIRDEQTIDIAPLTILAGANSSGKSSMMQPLLLVKQTLDAHFEPRGLLLDGPYLSFSDPRELLSRTADGGCVEPLAVGITLAEGYKVATFLGQRDPPGGLQASKTTWTLPGLGAFTLTRGMSQSELTSALPPRFVDETRAAMVGAVGEPRWEFAPQAAFLRPELHWSTGGGEGIRTQWVHFSRFARAIENVIYVTGRRGGPRRAYQEVVVWPPVKGRFEEYVGSLIESWEAPGSASRLDEFARDTDSLVNTAGITAERVQGGRIAILVNRLPAASAASDKVNLADVGLGVRQVLPVVAALHAAGPENLVYIEDPESHLHPRAQVALAAVLARAVSRGVRVAIETHSGLLLLAIQATVAEGKEGLSGDQVGLHWFERAPDGATHVRSTTLDDAGAFGDWPVDFGDVEMHLEKRYLDAAELKLAPR